MSLLPPGSFDRKLARHLAQLLHKDAPCDEALVRGGYLLARDQLALGPVRLTDPYIRELESYYVGHDLSAIQPYEQTLRKVSVDEASELIFTLLQDDTPAMPK